MIAICMGIGQAGGSWRGRRVHGGQLFSESAEHVLTAPKVGNRHQVYGPTLAPADTFLQSQVQIARGVTVGVHTFSQLLFDIVDVEREWANVCPVDAHTILHRSTEVVRAARRPPHRLELHAEFSVGVFWKLVVFHSDPPVVVWAVSTPRCSLQTN